MADSISTLALRVDSQSAISGLNQFGAAATALGGTADALKGKLLALSGAFLSLNFGKSLINDAAYGQEALGKFEQVLGAFAGRANNIVNDLTANFNNNVADAQQSIATMVDTFKKAGLDTKAALDITESFQKRAADLEAFTNAAEGVPGITEAMTAAILGNTRSIRKYGVVLTDAMIKAQMAENRIKGMTFATEQQARSTAIANLIMKQTASAEGQVAREADNYSNKLRKLKATVADLRGELGEALIPAATKVVGAFTTVAQALEKTSPRTKALIVGVGALGGAYIALSPFIVSVVNASKMLGGGLASLIGLTGKETAATAANTTAEAANATATNATVASKNLEATARMRNAAAIKAETLALRSNSVGKGANALGNAAHHVAGRKGGAASTLGNVAAQSIGGAVLGKGAKSAKLATTALGSLSGKKGLGGLVGVLGKLAKPLGKMNGLFGKAGTLIFALGGKLPIVGRFVTMFAKLGMGLSNPIGWILTALTVLKGFKDAPQWIEKFLDEGWPKIKDFAAELPGKIGNALKEYAPKIGNYFKDLLVGGILGMGQTFKRALGFETEASKAYKLNKQMEEINKRRQELLGVEEKTRKAELAAIAAHEDALLSLNNAQMKIAVSHNDENVQAQAAKHTLDDTQAKIDAKMAQLEGQYAEIDVGDGKKQTISIADINAAQMRNTQEKQQIQARMGERYKGLKTPEEYQKADELNKADAARIKRLDAQNEKLDEKRQIVQESLENVTREIETLSDSLVEQTAAYEQLAETAREAKKAQEEEQKEIARQNEERQKALEANQRSRAIETAETHTEKLAALQADKDAKDAAVQESIDAEATANEKNEQIVAIQNKLNDEAGNKVLGELSRALETGEGKDAALLAAKATFNGDDGEGAGYEFDKFAIAEFNDRRRKKGLKEFNTAVADTDDAAEYLDFINAWREDQREQAATLTDERNRAFELAGERAAREQERDESGDAIKVENDAFNDAKLEADKAEDRRAKDELKVKKSRQKAYDDELYSRQLSAIDANIDERDPWGRFNAAGMKANLVASKGMADWNDAQEELGYMKEDLDRRNAAIEDLQKKRDSGEATEKELSQLSEMESERDSLQSEYDQKYDDALNSRWSTEKELFGLQKEMADEQDKQFRNFAAEQGAALKSQLEEQARAAEEENQKRLAERSEVEKEQRQAVSGAKAIAAGTSEAFQIQSKIYDRGQENLPPEKKIEKSTEKIEKYVAQMQEQLYQYLSGNSPLTISMGY